MVPSSVANVRLGLVFLEQEHVLVNAKLFIPQEWNDNPARCRNAWIPEKEYRQHKTRHKHCLEMLKQGKLLPVESKNFEYAPANNLDHS